MRDLNSNIREEFIEEGVQCAMCSSVVVNGRVYYVARSRKFIVCEPCTPTHFKTPVMKVRARVAIN